MNDEDNQRTAQIIRCAIEVHKALGPGLLESVYSRCLACELSLNGIAFQEQVPVPIFYKKVRIESAHRMDFLVDRSVVVEVKAVERLMAVHESQLLTYLRLTRSSLGLLINFNSTRLVQGVRRFKR